MTLRELQIKLLNYDDLEQETKKIVWHTKNKEEKRMSKEITSKFHCLSQTRLNRSRRRKNIFFDAQWIFFEGKRTACLQYSSPQYFSSHLQSCCCIRKSHKTMMMMEMKFIFLSGHEISFHKISRDCSLSFLFADFFINFFYSLVGVSLFFREDGTLLRVELRAIVVNGY